MEGRHFYNAHNRTFDATQQKSPPQTSYLRRKRQLNTIPVSLKSKYLNITVETADPVLMSDDLSKIPMPWESAGATNERVQRPYRMLNGLGLLRS